VLVWGLVGLGAAVLIVFALVLGPLLFTSQPAGRLTAEQTLKSRNDVRTTLVQALAGIAAAGGLIVTYRSYRANVVEQKRGYDQRQGEQDRTYERELYARAVDQLGQSQAPVRLAAMYSLASLAQDRPDRRQMVVDVLCAYLRMPFAQPTDDHLADPKAREPNVPDPSQELQVRQTAQRILADHLSRPSGLTGQQAQNLRAAGDLAFWPHTSLDLTGATLVDFTIDHAAIIDARFARAVFVGDAGFRRATFAGDVSFTGARFTGVAGFGGARFAGRAGFGEAVFVQQAGFDGATFGATGFAGAEFGGNAWFRNATFTDGVGFGGATFAASAEFGQATFEARADFRGATYIGRPALDGAMAFRLDDPLVEGGRFWPPSWTVRPNQDDPACGSLVYLNPLPNPASSDGAIPAEPLPPAPLDE